MARAASFLSPAMAQQWKPSGPLATAPSKQASEEAKERFKKGMTSLGDAVQLAVSVGRDRRRKPIILADVADNPGGGARGNTTYLLRALKAARAKGVMVEGGCLAKCRPDQGQNPGSPYDQNDSDPYAAGHRPRRPKQPRGLAHW